jgi:insulysin
MDERIEAFVHNFRSKLFDMPEEEFTSNIDAVVQSFLEKDKSIGEESKKYWDVIANETYVFKRLALIAAELKEVTKDDILQFFDKYIAKNAPKRTKFCVQVFAERHIDKLESEVSSDVVMIGMDEVSAFKRQMPLHPLPEKVDLSQYEYKSTLA